MRYSPRHPGYQLLNAPVKPTAGSWWLCPPEEFYSRAESHKHRLQDSLGSKLVEQIHIRRMEACRNGD